MIDKCYTLIVLETDNISKFPLIHLAVTTSDWSRYETWLAPLLFSVRQSKLPVIPRLPGLVPMQLYNQWVSYPWRIYKHHSSIFCMEARRES